MTVVSLWLTIIGMGVITYGLRLGSLLIAERVPLAGGLRLALRFIPVSTLSAIIFLEVFMVDEKLALSPLDNVRIGAALAAVITAHLSKSVLLTIIVGMVMLWVLRFVLSSVAV